MLHNPTFTNLCLCESNYMYRKWDMACNKVINNAQSCTRNSKIGERDKFSKLQLNSQPTQSRAKYHIVKCHYRTPHAQELLKVLLHPPTAMATNNVLIVVFIAVVALLCQDCYRITSQSHRTA